MADVGRPALITEILSGVDGPHDANYPKWVPEWGRMMLNKHDTPEHRAYFERMKIKLRSSHGPTT